MRFQHYEAPKSLDACLQMLRHYGSDGRILAGGTDVIPRLRQRVSRVSALIDVTGIPELCAVSRDSRGILVGAAERLSDVQLTVGTLTGPYRVLSVGAGHVSSLQVRNAATLGGNLCNASPSADTVPPMIVLGAIAQLYGPAGAREIPVEELLLSPGRTALLENELLTGVLLPPALNRTGTAYHKYSIRGDSDIAIVGAAASLTLDTTGVIQRARIALGAVGPKAVRPAEAERLLVGQTPSLELFAEAAQLAKAECAPITDQRATADYRREMVCVWTVHALTDALANARSNA